MSLHVGTSGYSYPDWRGPVYPTDLAPSARLPFYANLFDAVELNFTYYRMPTAEQLRRIASLAAGRLRFAVKLHGSLTHERQDLEPGVARMRAAVAPLVDAGVLGAVLAQFPFSFRPEPDAWRWLSALIDGLHGLPLVVEFRHAAWFRSETWNWLARREVGACMVDLPRLAHLPEPDAVVTGRVGYVRLHGRNAAHWWRHATPAQRYDYRYAVAELADWVPRIGRMVTQADAVFVFANNHFAGQAVEAIQRLADLLIEAGLLDRRAVGSPGLPLSALTGNSSSH